MQNHAKTIRRIVVVSLLANILLTILKLTFGYIGKSHALVSDGFNSFSDILVSIVMLFALKVSQKKPDFDHPYGHEKFEGIITLFLSLVVAGTAIYIMFEGVVGLTNYLSGNVLTNPDLETIYVAVLSLIIKVLVTIMNYIGYKKFRSVGLKADYMNHLTDILSIFLVLLAVVLAQFQLVYIDYIAGIVIGIIIFITAFRLLRDALSYLVDQAPDKEIYDAIYNEIQSVSGVIRIDDLKIRKHVIKLYVDCEITVDGKLSLKNAHEIAEKVHDHIEHQFQDVLHIMVHVNPD